VYRQVSNTQWYGPRQASCSPLGLKTIPWEAGTRRATEEHVPRLVDSLVGKKVSGAVAGGMHTAAWTEAGRSSLLGHGGRLGHGEEEDEDVPRLVAALAGKKVVGAAAGADYTAVWTDGGELFTCGGGHWGKLGHGVTQNEPVQG
jgi:RCC1 and BTB domain-containing protein